MAREHLANKKKGKVRMLEDWEGRKKGEEFFASAGAISFLQKEKLVEVLEPAIVKKKPSASAGRKRVRKK
jgi:hypothetical protein